MKRTLCFLFSLLVLLGACAQTVGAAEAPGIAVGDVCGCAGETVSVPLDMVGNPGVVALRIYVEYDPTKLQLIEAVDGGLFGDDNAYFGHDPAANPYTLMWEDGLAGSDYTTDGRLAALTFRIPESAPAGKTDVTIRLDAGSTFNVGLENVVFTVDSGSVQIGEKADADERITGFSVQDLTLYYKDGGSLQTRVQGSAAYTIDYRPENDKLIAVDENSNVETLHWGTTKVVATATDAAGNTWTDECTVQVNCRPWQWAVIILLFGWLWY